MATPTQIAVSSVIPSYMRPSIPYESFNRMQSKCLEAWDSDENLLVAAPTGSGKTVCFELAILRHLHRALGKCSIKHLDFSSLHGKIVFLAPTKALCAEKEKEWKNKFGYLGLSVEMINGDVDREQTEARLATANLILTTAEKLDVVTRNLSSAGETDLTSQISLLLLDEVHQLGDSRGAKFEAVITRMLVVSDECRRLSEPDEKPPSAFLRIVAVSATIANATDIGSWLRVRPELIKEFDQSYRPVKLEFHVVPYQVKNRWQSAKVFDTKILDVLNRFAQGKPTLVFCPSRRQSMLSAKYVANEARGAYPGNKSDHVLLRHINSEGRRELLGRAATCKDKELAGLVSKSIAVHNADMSQGSRQLVEELFRKGLIQCLFSTSTLAQGVNLPARLVIICGTALYQDGQLREYDRSLILQMCGRAGRPGLDSHGVAVIMTTPASANCYRNIENTLPPQTESQLESVLEECFNAEVARQFITDMPSAISFLNNTYYAILEREKLRRNANCNKLKLYLKSIVKKKLDALSSQGLIRVEDDGFGISCTPIGICMAKYCLSFKAMKILISQVSNALSPATVLRTLATCPEVLEGICVRRTEKKKLNELNTQIRLPIYGKVKEPVEKVVILLQAIMGDCLDSIASDFALRSEASRLIEVASRIARCLVAIVLEKSIDIPYEAIFAVLQACRAVVCKTYWDGATTLLQVPGIDRAMKKKLAKSGISTIDMLAQSIGSIDSILKDEAAKAKDIRLQLRTFPKFYVEVACRRDGMETVYVDVNVSASGQVGSLKGSQHKSGLGFILIGSHAVGLIGIKTFKFADMNKSIGYTTSIHKHVHENSWIDVIVGCDSKLGVDVVKRMNVSHNADGVLSIVQQPVRSTPKGIPMNGRKRLSLPVTAERVSKKLKREILLESAIETGFAAPTLTSHENADDDTETRASIDELTGHEAIEECTTAAKTTGEQPTMTTEYDDIWRQLF